jgi:hypothetical protein
MLSNIAITSVRDAKVTWTDATIDVSTGADAGGDAATSMKIPLSTQYGFRSTIRITP